MKVTLCKTVCKNCPFKRENSASLFVDSIKEMLTKDIISPCHMDMVKYTGSENQGVEVYAKLAPRFMVCRGFAEARKKANIEANSAVWKSLYESCGNEYNEKVISMKEIL